MAHLTDDEFFQLARPRLAAGAIPLWDHLCLVASSSSSSTGGVEAIAAEFTQLANKFRTFLLENLEPTSPKKCNALDVEYEDEEQQVDAEENGIFEVTHTFSCKPYFLSISSIFPLHRFNQA